MKKAFLICVIIALLMTLTSCAGGDRSETTGTTGPRETEGGEREGSESTEDSKSAPTETTTGSAESGGDGENTPESIVASIKDELSSATDDVNGRAEAVFDKIGDSFDTYRENKAHVASFYEESMENARAMYARIDSASMDFFKSVAAGGLDDFETWDGHMEDFYDAWDGGMSEYYDAWNEQYDRLYQRCDELITESDAKYEETSGEWSEMYKTYSDSWSGMYKAYSEAWSDGYGRYSAIWSGFYSKLKDVEAILADAEKETKPTEESGPVKESEPVQESEPAQESEPVETGGSTQTNGIRPEFKEALDEYEAFYREYVDFIKSYDDAGSPISMLTDYLSMLKRLEEAESALNKIRGEEMSTEEAIYFSEVSQRVLKMLQEIA